MKAKEIIPYLFTIAALIIIAISACITSQSPVIRLEYSDYTQTGRFHGLEAPVNEDVFFDNATGVYYAIFWNDAGLSVVELHNIDGLPLCVDDANHGFQEQALEEIHGNLKEYDQ